MWKEIRTMCTHGKIPCFLSGRIVKGFGRGSKALGIPTANLEDNVAQNLPDDLKTGIYYGWASVDGDIHKMVASIGWNPFYKNEKKSVEVHLLHQFEHDLYEKEMKVIFTGYIRPEKDFSSVDELIKEINNDIAIAQQELQKPEQNAYKNDQFFLQE